VSGAAVARQPPPSRRFSIEEGLQGGHPTRSAGHEDLPAALGRGDELAPTIRGIRGARDQAVALEGRHESRHRRRAHALVPGETPDRSRAAEDEDGQGREAGRALAAGPVLAGEPPQEMEDGRMEPGREIVVRGA
jgi:hypothetical protein